jgi:hypothetical protein
MTRPLGFGALASGSPTGVESCRRESRPLCRTVWLASKQSNLGVGVWLTVGVWHDAAMMHRTPKVVLISDPSVRDVPIRDCGEDLVDPRGEITTWVQGPDDGSLHWVRSSVRDRLVHAAQLLRPAYDLAVNEGWRPPAIQARGFD